MSIQTESASADKDKSLIRVRPRGFCAGVVRAVDIVDLALQAYGPPVYVHHEIVHNRYVVEQLRQNGAIFVETVEEVPLGAVLVFSAHGVPPTTREEARIRELRVIDATCPLVTKVHLEALKFARENRTIILIGHRDHQEIVGTSGEAPQQTVVVDSVEAVDALVNLGHPPMFFGVGHGCQRLRIARIVRMNQLMPFDAFDRPQVSDVHPFQPTRRGHDPLAAERFGRRTENRGTNVVHEDLHALTTRPLVGSVAGARPFGDGGYRRPCIGLSHS